MGGKNSEKKVHDKEKHEKKKKLDKDYNDSDVVENKLKKKKKHEKDYTGSDVNEAVECLKENEEEEVSENNAKVDNKRKKKKKKSKMCEVDDGVVTESAVDGDGCAKSSDANEKSEAELKKKEKKRKKIDSVDSESQLSESMGKKQVNEDRVKKVGNDGGKNADNVEGEKAQVDQECENGIHKDGKKRKRGKDSCDEVGTKKKSSKLDNGVGKLPVKERKKKKKSDSCVLVEAESQEITKDSKDAGSRNLDGGNKVKKKNGTKANRSSEGNNTKSAQESGRKGVESTDLLENSARKKKSKTVSFSEDVEIFPAEDMGNNPSSSKRKHSKETAEEKGLIWGKRFSKEEDEMLREAVNDYITNHNLGDHKDAIEKIMNCRKHPEVKHCWKEIAAALPYRPTQAVYYRAHILYQRSDTCAWTQEELDEVREFYQKHGADWKTLAEKLGKHRFHVKDAWRRIKFENSKKGHWSQEEFDTLFDLVNQNLRLRALGERKTKHGMLRDNISWTAISEKLETRNDAHCCTKWYNQLTSPMVAQGEWLDTDDYRLLIALYELDASCMEDVDWDCLLEHRSGDVCRKRWNEMVKHLGEVGNKSFAELVDVLQDRYCPDVLEAREIYESKTPVDE